MLLKPDHHNIVNPVSGLVSLFLFDSQASDKEYDVFGSNHGVVSGGSWESNDQGLTYHLEDADYIDFGETEWSIEDEFSIFMRLCIRSNVAGVDYDAIFQRGRYFFPFAIRLSSYNELDFRTRTSGASGFLGDTLLSLNVWYDLFFTRDAAGNKVIYVDGVSDGSDTHTGTLDFGSGQKTILGVNYDEGVDYSDIDLSCLAIFNKALTGEQVAYFDPFEQFVRNRFRGFHVAAATGGNPWYYYAQQ